MLELLDIHKDYLVDKKPIPALKGISLSFGDTGFVSILGHSGCGKTTLLNIIGGLDHYTSGDLLIDNKSTKSFSDRDWDAYRNVRIGFVFQSYNLISHQTILSNVETPLILNGAKKAERKEKALAALKAVGLEAEAKKKPNQLSGGQMQRVAIARALVNDPKIILADEPTGALDSNTSVQVMDILKEVSKEKLIIMVTHNRELAERYSDRIIEMKDGVIVGDSAPVKPQSAETNEKEKNKKTSMSFLTAFKSSLSNIRTKKTRTILTAVASSIGLIGVALVLSITNGFTKYVNNVEKSVASSVPISIVPVTYNYSSLNKVEGEMFPDEQVVKVNDTTSSIVSVHQNKFTQEYYEYLNALTTDSEKSKWVDSILYNRLNQDFHLLTRCGDYIMQPSTYQSAGSMGGALSNVTGLPAYVFHELYVGDENLTEWYDCIAGKYPTAKDEIVLIVDKQNRVDKSTLSALGFFDPDQTITDKEISFDDILKKTYKVYRQVDWYRNDEYKSFTKKVWEVDRFNDETFQLEAHESTQEVHYFQRTHNFAQVYGHDELYNPLELKIVGIIRPSKDTYINLMPASLGYTTALKEYMIADGTDDSDPATRQANIELDAKIKEAATTNVYLPKPDEYDEDADGLATLNSYFSEINVKNKGESHTMQEILQMLKDGKSSELDDTDTAKIATAYSNFSAALNSALGYSAYYAESNKTKPASISRTNFLKNAQKVGADLKEQDVSLNMTSAGIMAMFLKWGGVDGLLTDGVKSFFNTMDDINRTETSAIDYIAVTNSFSIVTSILIFPSSLTVKDKLIEYLDAYNYYEYKKENGLRPDEEQIIYTDVMSTFTETVGVLVNVISLVLIVFASISLVVSSIMTGIITYVSVVERTKEIGVLRACGARKKDVGRLFEAECVVIGGLAGIIGVVFTAIADIPINYIVDKLYPGNNLNTIARLNPWHAVVLILLAILLAFISGLIPARVASNKDPVIALRSE